MQQHQKYKTHIHSMYLHVYVCLNVGNTIHGLERNPCIHWPTLTPPSPPDKLQRSSKAHKSCQLSTCQQLQLKGLSTSCGLYFFSSRSKVMILFFFVRMESQNVFRVSLICKCRSYIIISWCIHGCIHGVLQQAFSTKRGAKQRRYPLHVSTFWYHLGTEHQILTSM